MSHLRKLEIAERLTRFLARFSPPAAMRDNRQAMQDETDAMLRRLLHHAPPENAGLWADRVFRACELQMQTRAWPTVREIDRACEEQRRLMPGTAGDAVMLDRLEAWFRKFGGEMPGCGTPDRTAALIRRGVLASERDARHRGFTLSAEQAAMARTQPPTAEEVRQHERVRNGLMALNARLAAGRSACADER